MSVAEQDLESWNPPNSARQRLVRPVPHEGQDGLFSQSWFPIALSSEIAPGQVIGRDFLDGRIVLFRGENGVLRVLSAYCPHVGADLAVGTVVGDRLQCAFHRWEYNQNGVCVKTGVGDPPPRNACLFNFPMRERYGIVWVFNGEEPLWELMEFDVPEDRIAYQALAADTYLCDGWVFAANTPDVQHIKAVHGIRFDQGDPHDQAVWDRWGFRMKFDGVHQNGEPISWGVGIRGSSTYIQEGLVNGWWLGVYAGFSLPRPGQHVPYLSICVERGDGSPESEQQVRERLAFGRELLTRTAVEDKPILDTIHYDPGTLTRGDRTLAKYMELLRNFPRAHPSANFIR